MTPEQKERTLVALRSGEYKQGRRCLRNNDDEFCCLGVISDVFKDDVGLKWVKEADGDGEYFTIGYTGGVLPGRIRQYLGLDDSNPHLYSIDRSCATANDTGYTFEQIADAIEKEW